MPVDAPNAEQRSAWNGDQGAYWAERAERIDAGVAGYHQRFLDAAAIAPADRVLDIGCGSGQTTRDAARRAAEGSALGVDLSAPMLDLARGTAAAERVPNVTFVQADAQVHPFPDAHFDVAISRHGSMFFGDPPAAFGNIARALRPGGRLVLLTWQPLADNEWMRTFRGILTIGEQAPAQRGPWSMSDPDSVRELLDSAGFTEVDVRGLTAPMYYGRDVEDAADFVLGMFGSGLAGADPDTRAGAVAALRNDIAAHTTAEGVYYDSAAWLVTARRVS
ncbi:class I SAM-dependent methyltransferase [Actinophytocola gossypii]|uniref:Methyltransferase domain-containing protein n=1 Tax=Actinophytocola gossypii TaxID=2812003 RepID=A0ABT2JG56_9PSEU|nr:class I SAM-dependent methyltransferase [Actinophytocola gossypii]MCT2586743.1 methyltransferase domain-containing protein [Actinophytocola gossypii]